MHSNSSEERTSGFYLVEVHFFTLGAGFGIVQISFGIYSLCELSHLEIVYPDKNVRIVPLGASKLYRRLNVLDPSQNGS